MISYFEQGILISLEDGYAMASKGMDPLFEIFKHLSEGGTVDDCPGHNRMEVGAILGVVYTTLQQHLAQTNDNDSV